MRRSRFFPTLALLALAAASPALAETDVVRIDEPKVEGVLLDWCRKYAEKCGQPAADAFCRASGHRRSLRFVQWIDVGKPTKIISDGSICDSAGCDSFRWIECRTKN